MNVHVQVVRNQSESSIDTLDGVCELLKGCEIEEGISENANPTSLLTEEDKLFLHRIESTDVTFDDVCGMDEAKQFFKSTLTYQSFDFVKNSGFLLFGPPGSGKSFILKAVVEEVRAQSQTTATNFFSISMSDEGISEQLLKKLFVLAELEKPSIIFISDVDCLTVTNSNGKECVQKMREAFCEQMEKVADKVFVIANTNYPLNILDDLRVKSHFKNLIYISLPNRDDRLKMLEKRFTDGKCEDIKKKHLKKMAKNTRGFSGRDIDTIYKEALNAACERIQGTSKPVLIKIKDIRKSKWSSARRDFKHFDEIAEKLDAINGNQGMEPIKVIKVSRTGKFFARFIDFF